MNPSKAGSSKASPAKNPAISKVASPAKNNPKVASPAKNNPKVASPAKKSQVFNPKSTRKSTFGLIGLFVIMDGKNGEPASRLSLSTFQRMHDINPTVVLERCDEVIL